MKPSKKGGALKKAVASSGREHRLVDVVRKAFGKQSAFVVGDELESTAQIKGYLSTGLDVLDHHVVGRGGVPLGRISEVYSESEGAGKTALLLQIMGMVQRAGGVACAIDPEHSFDEERARTMGVDLGTLMMLKPDYLEQLYDQVNAVVEAHDGKVPLFFGWDSVACTMTKREFEGENPTVAEVAGIMSRELKRLLAGMHRKRVHLMALNQIRARPGIMFGPTTTTPGGNALKFYSSLRLTILGGKKVEGEKEDSPIGKDVIVKCVKSRLTSPNRVARVRFNFERGFDNEWSTIEHAVTVKALKVGERKPRGRKAYEEACAALGWPVRDDVDLAALDAGKVSQKDEDDS